jgi:hypothetical protein
LLDSKEYYASNNDHPKSQKEIIITTANTDLLFKLFENIEDKEKIPKIYAQLKSNNSKCQLTVESVSKNLIKGEDPCILNAEDLFPSLKLDSTDKIQHQFDIKAKTLSSSDLSNALLSFSSLNHRIRTNNDPIMNHDSSLFQTNQIMEQNFVQELSDVVAVL